ncbi:MAG: hypothetical protein K6A62_04330 [Bacteroidales bacterium]|nr:hypothetical protein [Bacteroidales bacterium]
MKKIISVVILAACAMMLFSCKNASKTEAVENVEAAVEAVENAADSLAVEEVADAVDSTVVAE